MKKHLVIVCGVYYPDPSPVGICVNNLIKSISGDFNIDVVCLSNNGRSERLELESGVSVTTLCNLRAHLQVSGSAPIGFLARLLGAIQIKIRRLGNLTWFRKKVLKELLTIQQTRPIDTILTVCSPFAAHCGGADFKKRFPAVRWVAYSVDPFSVKGSIRSELYSFDSLVSFEKAIYNQADCVLLSEEMYASRKDLYDTAKRCVALPYMLPDIQSISVSSSDIFEDDCVNCVYAGRFYETLRNPAHLLGTFSSINSSKIKLHLYSVGCDRIVQSYLSDNIILHKRVPHDEMLSIYTQADILVNVGNASADFMPSKTFEYLATGRPIVEFYSDGYPNAVLEKYPLACLVNSCLSVDLAAKQVEDFIKDSIGKTVSANQVDQIYKKHTEREIRSVLLDVL